MSSKRIIIALIVGAIAAIIYSEIKQDTFSDTSLESLPNTVTESVNQAPSIEYKAASASQKHIKATTINPVITKCETSFDGPTLNSEAMSKLEAENTKMRQIIAETSTLESEFTTLITSEGSMATRLERTLQLNQQYADNPLVSYELLLLCSNSEYNCSAELVASTVQKDPNNGAAWLLAAIYHASNNDSKSAEFAIIEASKAPNFDDYLSDYSSTFSTAYKQAGAEEGVELDVLLMGYVAALSSPSYGALFKLCKQAPVDNAELLEACLTSGQLFANQSSSQISRFIGNNIQKNVLTKLGNDAELARIVQAKNEMLALNEEQSKALDLIWRNRTLREAWQAELIRNGEVKAAEFAINEALRVSNDPEIDECLVVN
ncbi:MAG: hypothetical protein ACPGR2_07700 [Psychrobium sp.]